MSPDRRKFITTTAAGTSVFLAGCGFLTTPAELELRAIDHPATAVHDRDTEVRVRVENSGGETGSDTVVLRLSDAVVDTKEISVESDETATASFTITGESYTSGTHTLTAEIDEDEYTSSITITEPEPANLTIRDLDVPRTVDHDEAIDVTVTVRNTGDRTADQDVDLRSEDRITSESVAIEGGASREITLIVPEDQFFTGEHTLTAATSNDERSTTVTVNNPNPYAKQTLVVSLEQRTPAIHDMQDIITEALGYWDDNAEQYAGYPIAYEYRANASNPDVEIVVVDEITNCGDHTGERIAGCAPLVQNSPPTPATIRIVDGYRKAWMTTTLIHELGHTLGLGHTAEPAHIMSNEIEDRIPDYDRRVDAIDAYVSAFDPFGEGGDDWDRATDAWSARNFEETETAAEEAVTHYRESQRAIGDARDTANALDEETASSRLTDAYRKARAMRLASEAAVRMGQEAQQSLGDPEPHRRESNDYVGEANQYTFHDPVELTTAFGFPDTTR